MSIGLRRPYQSVDLNEVRESYPPPPEYFESAWFRGRESIERTQLARLKQRALRAYQVPFFKRRWDAAGFDPRDLVTLGDLSSVPAYTIEDIRESIDASPPLGDYQGVPIADAVSEPVRLFMSGGTSGTSRPTLYTQWDREVGAILLARQLYMQGVRPGDVVLNSWAYATHNGAFAFDEAAHKWLNCVVLTTSTGNMTSTERQVEFARAYGAAAILGTGDYMLRFAEVAQQKGYDIERDFALRALPNIGDRDLLESTFGLPVYETYGFHEVQTVAVECPARKGLHIFEDAFVVEVIDPETGDPMPDGETGSLVVTEVYKTGSPQFRYHIQDLTFLHPVGQCECGSWLRRMGHFAGRGDNMVKLRGINVWPEAIGEVLAGHPHSSGDWFVRAVREGNRDEMVAMIAIDESPATVADARSELEQMLKQDLGVAIRVEVVEPGALDHLTEIHSSPKPKRFRDDR